MQEDINLNRLTQLRVEAHRRGGPAYIPDVFEPLRLPPEVVEAAYTCVGCGDPLTITDRGGICRQCLIMFAP